MKFNKPTLVTLTAPTCSGKSYLLDRLVKLGFSQIVGTTTRDPRSGEREGVDYYFITMEQSIAMEAAGEFAEIAEFRGNRYGVTHDEMAKKLNSNLPPIVILEPGGLADYEKYCNKHDWDIFKVFVTVTEKLKLERLNARTVSDICESSTAARKKIIETHTSRLLSITGDERLWQARNTWDAIVPGDDVEKALEMIAKGIEWRNSQNVQQTT